MALPSTKYPNNSRSVSGNVTLFPNDVELRVNTSSVPATINLDQIPAGYWNTPWRLYIYDESSNASVNNITINAGSGQTINGASTLVINVNSVRAIVSISSDTSFCALLSNFTSGGVTQAYTTVEDQGSPLPQRNVINFVGAGVVSTDGGGQTVVTIPGPVITQAYTTVQEEGSSLPQRSIINFVGKAVTATDSGGVTVVTIPGPLYFYGYKSLTTAATSTTIAPVSGGVNSVFGGEEMIEYTSKVESGLSFNLGSGEWTVPSDGLYTVNAKLTTRIDAADVNSITGVGGAQWLSGITNPGELAIGILIKRSSMTPNMIACSNKQVINDVNISDVNIECSSLLFNFKTSDVVYVVVFNKTDYTIVNLAVTTGLPDCYLDFSVVKLT